MCGRLYDAATFLPLLDVEQTVEVGLYNPIAFVGDPSNIDPLQVVAPDSCGYFSARDVTISQGLTAISINDTGEHSAGTADVGTWRRTARLVAATAGQNIVTPMLAVKNSLGWSGQAVPGAFVRIFIDTNQAPPQNPLDAMVAYPFAGAPVAGVTVVPTTVANDFYFTNTEATSLTMLDADGPANDGTTGASGASLLLGATLQNHSGVGPAGCTWPSRLAASVPGLIWVGVFETACN